ncbi:hypothetical protein PG985_015788 [Apiospora marii]|uniref:uncharacterized protein n=1 Tax=Apiospora marii TaxID=335849 RepID=UPI00312DC783
MSTRPPGNDDTIAGKHDATGTNRHTMMHRSRPYLPTACHSALLLLALLGVQPASAVLLPFENCLPSNYIASNNAEHAQLQWVPLYLDAKFDLENPTHKLTVTVYGNITGTVGNTTLPAWNDKKQWNGTNTLNGKIQNQPDGPQGKATTLFSKVDVLSYEPYKTTTNFCNSTKNGTCPLGPVFNETPIAFQDLPSFGLANDFSSSYAFTSFAPTLIIWNGDSKATSIGCISSVVTPSLGGISWFLRFLPVFVLLLVGVATVFAGVFSPWGTSDVFHWTSNYGRHPDLLRLVTPGFGDCLQYIQFIVLTGGLSLNYPGFYQPVVSNGAWSSLMFNQSFVSDADPWTNVVDGVYVTENITSVYDGSSVYGLESVSRLVGMSQVEDIWAGMMIWLLVLLAIILSGIQLGFFFRWMFRYLRQNPEEDLRAKNMPFSMGNVIRLVFSYFLLPIVTLSLFQLVVASRSSVYLVALAVVTIALIVGFAAWLIYLIASTRPRSHLFDDLPTVLLYGPLYNTYSDEAAAFALIPVLLTFLRGIALGAVQASGIAQLVILAACEVVQMLTLHAFRPFHSPTSMNAYHTGFSALRFVTVILMVAFSPSMGVLEGPKGWIGYVILLIHGGVLVFGFFLNALQTIIEVVARMCGAGGDDTRGQTRGGLSRIFGARQLQRRMSRRGATSRQSQLSTSAMLDTAPASKRGYGRVRSGSAGSMGILLHQQQRSSSVLDGRSIDYSLPMGGSNYVPGTPGEVSNFSFLPSPGQATRPQPTADPYYRPPRAARRTGSEDIGATPTHHRSRQSVGSIDLTDKRMSKHGASFIDLPDADGSPSRGQTPAPPQAYTPVFAPRADYSTREVDFYYGVRGPALNSDGPGRKLGTGPADPTSPVSTATGWLKGLFGGKTKEKGKGFEVVRSARMPPAMKARGGDFADDGPPEGIPVAMGVLRNGPIESDDEDSSPRAKKAKKRDLLGDDGEESQADDEEERDVGTTKVVEGPPLLPDLDAGESFNMPSRLNSAKTNRTVSKRTARGVEMDSLEPLPDVPRKSSKRNSGVDIIKGPLVNLAPSHEGADGGSGTTPARLPFDRTNSSRRLSGSSLAATDDMNSQFPSAGISGDSGDERPTSYGHVHQHSISRIDPSSDQRLDLLGSSAEVVEATRRASPGSSGSNRSPS